MSSVASLQLCPTLSDPMYCRSPMSPVSLVLEVESVLLNHWGSSICIYVYMHVYIHVYVCVCVCVCVSVCIDIFNMMLSRAFWTFIAVCSI